MQLYFPVLDEGLNKIVFFERERTDRQVNELATLLYGCGVSLCRIEHLLGWIGVKRSHVAIWKWIQKFGRQLDQVSWRRAADLPAVCLLDETVISQHGEEFTLFAAVDPEMRHILHAESHRHEIT